MNSLKNDSADTLAFIASVILLTALGWLLFERFSAVEQIVSHALFDPFAANLNTAAKAADDRSLSTALTRIGIAAGFATCGVIAGFKMPHRMRWLAFLQLIALNMVLHSVLVSMTGENLGMPISLSISGVLGVAFGILIKIHKDTQSNLEAKSAALENIDRELSASKLQMIREDEVERRVLAGDLHDQVLNDLKLLRGKLDQWSKNPQEELQMKEMEELIGRSMQQVREVMDSLSPAVLQHLGFVDAIEDCVRTGAERASCKVRFRCNVGNGEFNTFGQTELSLLYRLVQESMNNICKHAEATVVKCIVTADGDSIVISIIDDGKGLDTTTFSPQSRGLKYMQQRASIIGASIKWAPGDEGKGTRVEITVRKPK